MSRKTWPLLVAMFATAGASADTVSVSFAPFQAATGGEFQVVPITGFAGLTGLGSDVSASTYQTFCLERDEFVSQTTYDFSIDNGAIGGGYGGQVGSLDPISAQTAYLFTQFRQGTLSNYNYGGTVAQRKTSATALQIAIWILEDEYTGAGGPVPFNVQANAWITEANNAVAGAWGNTLGSVAVLNLSLGGVNNQSMLTLIPLPPAAWVGLSGLVGVVGVAAARRRLLRG
jgi:hypothetical protein